MPSSPMGRGYGLAVVFAVAFLIRLVDIGAPPIGMHSWRQADTAAMARNFHETGYRLLLPQIDWAGGGPGYVECEFPLYPYTAAALYRFLGVHTAIPRLLSILASLAAGWFLYRLTQAIIGHRTALWATAFFLLLPLNVFYGRAIMPESWMIGSSIAGIYCFHRWTVTDKPGQLVLSGLFIALAALLKLPALYLGLPLLYLAWLRFGSGLFRRASLWAYAVGILAAVAAWYYHSHRILLDGGVTFGIWEYGSDKWGNWELVASLKFWNAILFRSLAERWLTWPGLVLALIGLFAARGSRPERVFDAWLMGIAVYFVVVARGNYVHEYYQFPAMPVLAVCMGRAVDRSLRAGRRDVVAGLVILLLPATAVLSGARLQDYLRKEDVSRSREVVVGTALRRLSGAGDRVVTTEGGNPALLYLAHRKGWTIHRQDLTPEFLAAAYRQGARYVAGIGAPPLADPAVSVRSMLDLTRAHYVGQEGFVIRIGEGSENLQTRNRVNPIGTGRVSPGAAPPSTSGSRRLPTPFSRPPRSGHSTSRCTAA